MLQILKATSLAQAFKDGIQVFVAFCSLASMSWFSYQQQNRKQSVDTTECTTTYVMINPCYFVPVLHTGKNTPVGPFFERAALMVGVA